MGFDKLFAPLAGKPVLWHSIKAFDDAKDVDEVLLVTREDRMDEVEALVSDGGLKKVTKVISGGEERHISVWNGLFRLSRRDARFTVSPITLYSWRLAEPILPAIRDPVWIPIPIRICGMSGLPACCRFNTSTRLSIACAARHRSRQRCAWVAA